MGSSKEMLHHTKQNAKNGKPFTLNKHVRGRLVAPDAIEEQPLEVQRAQVFVNKAEAVQRILRMTQKEVEQRGVKRGVFKSIKDRIRRGEAIKLHTGAMRRLLE